MNYQIMEYKNKLLNFIKLLNSQSERHTRHEYIPLTEIQAKFAEWTEVINQLKSWHGHFLYYGIELLEAFYKQYTETESFNGTFTVQSLFSDGWLVKHKARWSFTISEYVLKKMRTEDQEDKYPEILFLKSLYEFLQKENDMAFPEIMQIRKEGALIFAVWWDSICETGNKEEKKCWFYWWDVLDIYGVYQYVSNKKELYCNCMEYVEEIQKYTWAQYQKIIFHKYILENKQGNKTLTIEDFNFPDRPLMNFIYFNERVDLFHSLHDPFRLEKHCFLLYKQAYDNMSLDERRKCCQYMNTPCLHLMSEYLITQSEFLTDCMEDPQMFARLSVLLWDKLKDIEKMGGQIKEKVLEEINENIFAVLKAGILSISSKEWKTALKDLLWYMVTYGADYNITATRQQKSVSLLHESFMRWYSGEREVRQKCNEEILNYLKADYERSTRSVNKMRFGAEYLIWVELYGGSDSGEKILEFYKVLIQDCMREKVCVSVVNWEFWEKKWHSDMLEYVADEGMECVKEFCDIISPEKYAAEVDLMKEKSPLLSVGKAGLVHLYMMADFIQKGDIIRSLKSWKEVQKRFVDCFTGYQKKDCDPFQLENIRILQAEVFLADYADAFCMLDDENEEHITNFLKTQAIEKIIFSTKNVKKITAYQQFVDILKEKLEEDFTKDLIFLPTMQKLIDTMLGLCYTDKSFKENFVGKIDEMYKEFRGHVNKRKSVYQNEYYDWMKEKELQLLFMNDNVAEIMKLPDDRINSFYKALVYLEKGEISDIRKAKTIYDTILKEDPGCYAANVNRFIAEVRMCVQSSGEEREKYYMTAKQHLSELEQNFDLKNGDSLLVYANALFLFEELGEWGELWKISEEMPQKFLMDISCARYIVYAHIKNGNFKKAENLVTLLQKYYGKTEELKELYRQIEDENAGKIKVPSGVQNEYTDIVQIRNALNRIHFLTEEETAYLSLHLREMRSPVESHLLCLMLETASVVSQYCDYLRKDGKAAPENYYNKMVMVLFNRNQQELYDYAMWDQTQEGTATNVLSNGWQSVGSLDLLLYHGSKPISIIEGVKIGGINETNIKLHIGKILGYNYISKNIHFLLLYADVDNIQNTWEKYQDFLKKLKELNEFCWKINRIVYREEIELIQKKLRDDQYICMTEHVYGGKVVKICHIMIDIKKEAEKLEALNSRNKKDRNF